MTGAGTATMGASITSVRNVTLFAATSAYRFATNGTNGLVLTDGSATADSLTLGGASQTVLGNAANLDGDTVGGFGALGAIDLKNIGLTAASVEWTQTDGSAGSLAVSDGARAARLTLLGQFDAAAFHVATDGGAGIRVTYS